MKRFDCLSAECPLLGPHLLEASAGTGKTFAIEHVFVRLLLEGLSIEKVLVVTFTRAATRELKQRIRSHLLFSLQILTKKKEGAPPYLIAHIESKEAMFILDRAIKEFDRAQIFTIHGFCFRMLQEFAFEAECCLSLTSPENPMALAQKRRSEFSQFLQKGIEPSLIAPEQLRILLGLYETLYDLGSAVLKEKGTIPDSFSVWHRAFQKKILTQKERRSRAQFEEIASQYKGFSSDLLDEFDALSSCLDHPEDPLIWRRLLRYRGALFSFLDPKNKKVKATFSDPFFDWIFQELSPIMKQALHPKQILRVLATQWKKWEEKWQRENGIFHPDAMLEEMRRAIKKEPFFAQIKTRFQAIIIDEFQDTDPLQWEIFQKMATSDSLSAFYLVGDPKQSIYRFRNADVYTYIAAKEFLGKENLYCLDTNFRSSPTMIEALNTLFSREWLVLPQTAGVIDYHPVQAGSSLSSFEEDHKGAVHWILGNEEASFKETFLPYAILEIEKLLSKMAPQSIAILVKDRYEMQQAMSFLQKRGIPSIGRSHEQLSETPSFQNLRNLIFAIASPENESARELAKDGPFAPFESSFSHYHHLLAEKGLPLFFSEFFQNRPPLEKEAEQVLEELFAFEQREGFSFEGIKRFLRNWSFLSEEEAPRVRLDEKSDAVQVLTLHVSKGLEFEVVFALSLASASPKEEEDAELNAEKLRLLYVAMTRAKKRLYIPFKPGKKRSPVELFAEIVERQEGPFAAYLERLAKEKSLSIEEIPTPFLLPDPLKAVHGIEIVQRKAALKNSAPVLPSFVQSFTTLSEKKEIEAVESNSPLPRGKETGTVIHELLEEIFSLKEWKEDALFFPLIEQKLLHTSLAPWTNLVQSLLSQTLSHPLTDGETTFCLRDLSFSQVLPEVDFLYPEGGNFIKGSIDLVFVFQGKIYFLDWKTNALKDTRQQSMEEVMEAHDYYLQAALYTEALRRQFGPSFQEKFGGAFYLFVREGASLHIQIPQSRHS